MKLLIEKYPHLNVLELKTGSQFTPLMYAAAKGQTAMAAYLCSKNANQYAATDDGRTALALAVKNGHVETTAVLMQASRDLAVLKDPVPTVPEIGARPKDAIAGDAGRPAALPITGELERKIAAAQNPRVMSRDALPPVVLMPINPDAENQKFVTHYAAKSKNVDLLKALAENYSAPARLLSKANAKGETPIHKATEKHDAAMVEYCISKGAALDTEVAEHKTALYRACEYPGLNKEIILMLIKAGAKLDVVAGADSRQPIHLAVRGFAPKIVKALVEKQSSLMNQVDANGFTPLVNEQRDHDQLIAYFLRKTVR